MTARGSVGDSVEVGMLFLSCLIYMSVLRSPGYTRSHRPYVCTSICLDVNLEEFTSYQYHCMPREILRTGLQGQKATA